MAEPLEIHEHWFVRGGRPPIAHSHEGGSVPHQHPQTGPAGYTIDKDEWLRATGLRGGGRKKFTAKPNGEQLPIIELEEWQKSFQVIIAGPPSPEYGEGPGLAPAARMVLAFRMKATVIQ